MTQVFQLGASEGDRNNAYLPVLHLVAIGPPRTTSAFPPLSLGRSGHQSANARGRNSRVRALSAPPPTDIPPTAAMQDRGRVRLGSGEKCYERKARLAGQKAAIVPTYRSRSASLRTIEPDLSSLHNVRTMSVRTVWLFWFINGAIVAATVLVFVSFLSL